MTSAAIRKQAELSPVAVAYARNMGIMWRSVAIVVPGHRERHRRAAHPALNP